MQNNYNIEYLDSFYEELCEILYYFIYNLKNKNAYKKLCQKIDKAILKRSYNPISFKSYQSKRNRDYNWYKIYIDNFIILYTVKENVMIISHIIYQKRNYDNFI